MNKTELEELYRKVNFILRMDANKHPSKKDIVIATVAAPNYSIIENDSIKGKK